MNKDFRDAPSDPSLAAAQTISPASCTQQRNDEPAEAQNPRGLGQTSAPRQTHHGRPNAAPDRQWPTNVHKSSAKRKQKVRARLGSDETDTGGIFQSRSERVTSGIRGRITYVYYVYLNGIRKGTPLDYVRTGKFLGDASYMSLFHKAPHPNAAKAFIDFFLDEESMSLMTKAGEFVNRKGVFPPVPDADKIQFVEMDDLGEKVYAEKRKGFHKLFLK
jgi:hypothetical protein